VAEANDTAINLRLPKSLKSKLQTKADARGLPLVTYIRLVLHNDTQDVAPLEGEDQ